MAKRKRPPAKHETRRPCRDSDLVFSPCAPMGARAGERPQGFTVPRPAIFGQTRSSALQGARALHNTGCVISGGTDSTADLLFRIGADSSDAESNIQRF